MKILTTSTGRQVFNACSRSPSLPPSLPQDIPGGAVEDSHYVDGLVFRKNVAHKAMRGGEGGRGGRVEGRGGGGEEKEEVLGFS